MKVSMEVKHAGDNVVATVTYQDGKEVWTWNDKTLNQQEIDVKTGKVVQQYGASASTDTTTNKQVYNINCTDKITNTCDAGIDARNNWTIEASTGKLKYTVLGVSKENKGNPAAKVEKRHEFTFNKVN
jgi:hypothetical protein